MSARARVPHCQLHGVQRVLMHTFRMKRVNAIGLLASAAGRNIDVDELCSLVEIIHAAAAAAATTAAVAAPAAGHHTSQHHPLARPRPHQHGTHFPGPPPTTGRMNSPQKPR
jgi:hypothetical protein